MARANPDDTVRRLGLDLPPVPVPVGNFRLARRVGDLVFLSGQGPLLRDGTLARGKVGADIDAVGAAEHAHRAGLVLLSALRTFLGGSLEDVDCVVKVLGFVNAVPSFTDHPRVIDGCSNLMRSVFGTDGEHARSAIGVGSLPGNIPVEIEMIVATRSRKRTAVVGRDCPEVCA